jgi:NarL family two-component system response regulator LiaR
VREREAYATEFGGVLSARETDVIALVSQGLSNQEISAELFLGINTIKTYIRTAYRKMGVKSRSQAVLWGLERGMALRVRA